MEMGGDASISNVKDGDRKGSSLSFIFGSYGTVYATVKLSSLVGRFRQRERDLFIFVYLGI